MGIVNRLISGIKTSVYSNKKNKSESATGPTKSIFYGNSAQKTIERFFSKEDIQAKSPYMGRDSVNIGN